MSDNLIITIGRECGSGGRHIGQALAEKLGIKCYDKELLNLAAKESGLCKELFETHDEKPTSSFLYSLVMDTYSLGYTNSAYMDMPINHKIFLAQFDTIKNLAQNTRARSAPHPGLHPGMPAGFQHWRLKTCCSP